MKKRKFNFYEAVFNDHVNNAGARAKNIMKEFAPDKLKEIEKFKKKGIMSIFHIDPTSATEMYVALVYAFVNEI